MHENNDALHDNFEWYKEHLPELYQRYGDCFLAIKDKRVIGTYATYGEAVRETSKAEGLGTFNVQQCGPTSDAYTAYVYWTSVEKASMLVGKPCDVCDDIADARRSDKGAYMTYTGLAL